MPTQALPNNLREFRKRAGLRQIDVARLLHLDCADRLSRWENGSAMPNIVNLFRLARLYQVHPHEIYRELFQSVENESSKLALNKANSVNVLETCEK
jgi:transcriptional regulator with XRE-family HTH domain